MQRREHLGRDFALLLDARGVRGDQGTKRACPRDAIAGIVLRERNPLQHDVFRLPIDIVAHSKRRSMRAPADEPVQSAREIRAVQDRDDQEDGSHRDPVDVRRGADGVETGA